MVEKVLYRLITESEHLIGYIPTGSCLCRIERILITFPAASTQVFNKATTSSNTVFTLLTSSHEALSRCCKRTNRIGRVAIILYCSESVKLWSV